MVHEIIFLQNKGTMIPSVPNLHNKMFFIYKFYYFLVMFLKKIQVPGYGTK